MKWLVLLVIVGAGVGGYYYWKTSNTKTAATTQAVTTATVARGNLFQAVSCTGRVVSNLDVEIKCKASGQIIELPYSDVSQVVTKDSLIVQIDPIDQQRAVRQAEVELEQSQARQAQAEKNLAVAQQNLVTARERNAQQITSSQSLARDAAAKAKRRRELFEQKLTSPEELQAAETLATQAETEYQNALIAQKDLKTQEIAIEVKKKDVDLAKAVVENDQIALATAKQRLADTTVTAPMDGVVASLNVQKGQIIASGVTNVAGGTTIMTLSDLSRIFVLASVDESDIGKVGPGQEVLITADAFAGTRFKGKVVRIATKGVNVSNVVTFEVKVEVTSENKSKLKPEMTANVQIVAAEAKDVLLVPVTGLTRKGGKMTAMLKKNGANEEREVTVGLTDGEKYEVTKGLAEGDVIVLRKDEQQSRWREGGGGPRPPGMGVTFPGGGRGR